MKTEIKEPKGKNSKLHNAGVMTLKILLVAICLIALYLSLGHIAEQDRVNWTEYASADVTYKDGIREHFDSNVLRTVNKGDFVDFTIKLPAEKYIEAQTLCFHTYSAVVKAYFNNDEIFSYGENLAATNTMIGGVYAFVDIPEAAWGSEIHITMDVCDNNAFQKISSFDMYPSSYSYKYLMKNNIFNLFISIGGIVVGLAGCLILLFSRNVNRLRLTGLCVIGFALLASIWIFTNSGLFRLFFTSYFWVPLEYIVLYSLPIPLVGYLMLTENRPITKRIDIIIMIIVLLFVVTTAVLNGLNKIHFVDTLTVGHVVLLLSTLYIFVASFRRFVKKEKNGTFIVIGFSIMMVFALIDIFRFNLIRYIPLFAANEVPSVLSLGLTGLAMMLALSFYYDIKEEQRIILIQQKEMEQLKTDLENSRIKVMINQMQPHFLYNALSAIRAITMTNPKYAYDLLYDFTVHLRSNIRSLSSDAAIPFTDELKNVEAYLNIERMRYGDKLEVKYDIGYDDFKIIPLSIQPIAENSVRHGIYPKGDEGGYVKISSRYSGNSVVVTVEDNGVGFDVESVLATKEDHVGVKSLRFRLKNQMNADVDISSELGKGSKVVITIPAESLEHLDKKEEQK